MNRKTYIIIGLTSAIIIAGILYFIMRDDSFSNDAGVIAVVTENENEEKNHYSQSAPDHKATTQPSANGRDIPSEIVKALARHQRPDGFIDYAFNLYTGEKEDIDNIIHQTEIGIVYIDYLEKHPDDIQIKKALQNLLNALTDKIKPGKYGSQLSFYVNDEMTSDEIKERQFRGEISATALMTAAMSRYRKLYSELDFATTESHVINTLIAVANFLISSNRLTSKIYQYPPYEIWYAMAVYSTAVAKSRSLENTMVKLDRFYASMESFIKDKDGLFYFFKTYDLRKNSASTYVKGAVLRNIKNYGKTYVNSYNPAELNCQNATLLEEAAAILKSLDKNIKLQTYFQEQQDILKTADLKLLITPNMTTSGIGAQGNSGKKFAGFFVSGYGNPITTIKNSISCYYAFSK